MERKPVTLPDDLAALIEGSIEAGEFSDRSSAVRNCIQVYFTTNLVATAALIASRDDLELSDVADVLDVDRDQLAQQVMAIDPTAVPEKLTPPLSQLEAEFESLDDPES